MTKRVLGVACLVTVVLSCHSTAEAIGWRDVWDTLDALSGPGPFVGSPAIPVTIVCWEDREPKFTHAMANPDRDDPCLYVDFRRLHVDPLGPYSKVTAKIVETGLSFEQDPAFDVGAGVGVAYFATTVDGTDYKVTNFTFTPRLVFKPLRLIPKFRDNPRMGFLQMHIRLTVRFGEIDGADFGVPASTFKAGTEVLRSQSLLVFDVLQLARGR